MRALSHKAESGLLQSELVQWRQRRHVACSQAELAKKRLTRRAALDIIFVYTGRLAKAVSLAGIGFGQLGIASSPLLAAINVLLQWLATHPGDLRYGRPEPTCMPLAPAPRPVEDAC